MHHYHHPLVGDFLRKRGTLSPPPLAKEHRHAVPL
jgi:hypothetical protein